MKNETLHKEIDLIQMVITRIANNSFLLKGWLITLISVILAFSKDSIVIDNITYLSLVLCLPVLIFWYLDAYFLHKEKCYRELYDWVIENRGKTSDYLYSLDYTRFKKKVKSTRYLMSSNTLVPIYGSTVFVLISIFIIKLF
jgi:hypothetical protein